MIERYIEDGQQQVSRTLAPDSEMDLSPATIRNVMADLEELGLISSPHTSAGRVPTSQGYRLFVDSLLSVDSLNQATLAHMEDALTAEADPETLTSRPECLQGGRGMPFSWW